MKNEHDADEEQQEETVFEQTLEIAKYADNDDKGYTYTLGAVLIPDKEDKQGDIISKEEIEDAAHGFMESAQRVGRQHETMLAKQDAVVVESFVTPVALKINKTSYPVGTWLVGMRVYNSVLRKSIKSGKVKGYSIGGRGKGNIEDAD